MREIQNHQELTFPRASARDVRPALKRAVFVSGLSPSIRFGANHADGHVALLTAESSTTALLTLAR